MSVNKLSEAHPLDQTLAKLRAMSEWYAAYASTDDTALTLAQADWVTASEMARADSTHWQKQLDESIAQSAIADKRLHGYGLFNAHTWLMTTAALACYLLDRRLPDLAPQHLRFCEMPRAGATMTTLRFAQPRFFCLPNDSQAQHPDATVVPDEAELRSHFHRQIETHFPPAMQAIQSLTGYLPRAMWAQTSDNVISVLITYVQHTGQRFQLEPLLAQFAKADGSPLNMRNGVLCVIHEGKEHLMTERASCCQWFRWPEAKGERCINCPGYSRAKRIEKLMSR